MTAIPPSRPEASPAVQALWMLASTALLAGWLAFTSGWPWALGAVVGVFVHEYGHVLAINAAGCGPGKIRIIPFLGGAATPAIVPPTEFKDVLISLAGPSFGLLAVLPFYAAFAATLDPRWLEAAVAVAVINLINLVPAPPLDGSRALGPVLSRIHPNVERGVLVLIGAAVVLWAVRSHNWIIAVFVGLSVLGALKRPSLRPFALRLDAAQQGWSLLLYLTSVALGLIVLHFTLQLAGLPEDPAGLLRAMGIRL